MKNLLFILFVALSLVFFMACSSDDNSPQQEEMEQMEGENPPSEFNVVVTSIYFDMASINWFQPEGLNNENLMYVISLNGSVIAENLSELNYTFENLEINTEYVVEITALNDVGTTISTIDFRTLNPEDYTFLLETYQNGQNRPVISYFYNARKLIIKAEDTSKYTGEIVTYVYDEAGNLVKERFVQSYLAYGGEAECTYENGQIIDYSYVDGGEFVILYDFISPDNYIIEDYIFSNLVSTLEVNLERSNGKITSCRVTDVDTQEVTYHYNFLYEDGNLAGRNNILTGDIWTYEYDDKNNFISNKGFIRKPGLGINHLSNYEIYFLNGFVPEFVDYFNKNNPTAVYKNGVLIHELTYEYTVFDYPSKIYYDNSEDPVVLTYSYIEN